MEVYKSIVGVAEELAHMGISKDSKNQQQGFMFRGIDAVYNTLAPLLAKHKLIILPRCLERTLIERQTAKGGNLFYVTVKCEFDFVSAIDASKHTVVMYGEAMDSGDKATNKAMSSAYKYAAFQAFCIPTEETSADADAETHQVAPRQKPVAKPAEIDLMPFLAALDAATTEDELKATFASAWKESSGNKSIQAHYNKLKAKFTEGAAE